MLRMLLALFVMLVVGVFLVVAHIAMIFGMMDPTLLMSGSAPAGGHMGH
ncbi:DUF6803 family protein [Pinisolibacter sp.]